MFIYSAVIIYFFLSFYCLRNLPMSSPLLIIIIFIGTYTKISSRDGNLFNNHFIVLEYMGKLFPYCIKINKKAEVKRFY